MAYRAGIVGGSGYTGAELLRLLSAHPDLEVVTATGDRHASVPVAALYPSLTPAYPDLVLDALDPAALDGLDVVFVALPHGESQRLVPDLIGCVGHVVDLGADFRLPAATYEQWYGEPHTAPELLARFTFGLPELFRAHLTPDTAVAAPGCYPTAAALALAPSSRSASRSRRVSSSTPPRASRDAAAARATPASSRRRTRPSPRTGSSPIATPARSSTPSARSKASRCRCSSPPTSSP